MMAALKPETQVQVWAIQALLADDKPRTYAEVGQTIGEDPQDAMQVLLDDGKIEMVVVEGVTFWRRRARK